MIANGIELNKTKSRDVNSMSFIIFANKNADNYVRFSVEITDITMETLAIYFNQM